MWGTKGLHTFDLFTNSDYDYTKGFNLFGADKQQIIRENSAVQPLNYVMLCAHFTVMDPELRK